MFYINTLSQKSDSEIGLQYIRMRIKTQLPKHCPTSAVYIEHEHEYELGYLYRNSESAVLVNVHPLELIIIILSWWSPYILLYYMGNMTAGRDNFKLSAFTDHRPDLSQPICPSQRRREVFLLAQPSPAKPSQDNNY